MSTVTNRPVPTSTQEASASEVSPAGRPWALLLTVPMFLFAAITCYGAVYFGTHEDPTRPAGAPDPGSWQAISLAVSPSAFEQAYRSLRRGGTLVFVGLPADNTIELPIFETVLNGITVVGSIVGTRVDLREVFELHAAGLTKVITEVRSLETVNDAIEDVEAGRVPARVVFVP